MEQTLPSVTESHSALQVSPKANEKMTAPDVS